MGAAMAPAALSTIKAHFQDLNVSADDYDLIVTGDLGEYGSKTFVEELESENIKIKDKHLDCGYIIYDKKTQNSKAGGSGPACVMAVTFTYIINKMIRRKIKKVLVIGTGALHSQISYQQKESIPCIAHAVALCAAD